MDDQRSGPGSGPEPRSTEREWEANYFNYFTEVEEHFRRARGTALFLLSPLDWALIDNWRTGGVPLESVLKGIDNAFEKWKSGKRRRNLVNSVAYCSQAVMEAANRSTSSRVIESELPFAADVLATYLEGALDAIQRCAGRPFVEAAESLSALLPQLPTFAGNFEELEQRLSALEEKIIAALRSELQAEDLFDMRQALESEIRPYRSKMAASQIDMLERRYLDSAILQKVGIPRLSLFYVS